MDTDHDTQDEPGGGGVATVAEGAEYPQAPPPVVPGATRNRGADIRSEDDDVARLPDAVETAAAGRGLTPQDAMDATEWFLAEDAEAEASAVKTIQINTSLTDTPTWVNWTFRTISQDELAMARRQAAGNRRARRGGDDPDESKVSLGIVAMATVSPDLPAICASKGVADPRHVLEHRFGHKPGLIGQIATEIILYSGHDTDDIAEAKEVRAAGN